MNSFFRLITLAAIWGGSFLFMRIAVNPLGPAVLIEARVGLAAVTLLVIALYLKKQLNMAGNAKHYFTLGLFNTVIGSIFVITGTMLVTGFSPRQFFQQKVVQGE